ncbi:MAG: S8 family peptidase [Rhodobacteraceae bacterium]|nr:S8 family peptidase [Paracoccaceae bacterium]MCY4197092.1 S8 family peptidase [Paracoccaceae bacterium]
MFVEVSPDRLALVKGEIQKAENRTRIEFSEAQDREIPHPTKQRSETGAIKSLELYGSSDKRSFSVEDAVAWLSNPRTGGGYEVELFDAIPPRADWDRLPDTHHKLITTFVEGFDEIGRGILVEQLPFWHSGLPKVVVRLDQSPDVTVMKPVNASNAGRDRRASAPFDENPKRHQKLLEFLDNHPLVRSVELPGVIVQSAIPPAQSRSRPDRVTIPTRNIQTSYPRIGIVDGGVGAALSDWIIDRWAILADEDMNPNHGTFIGGLAVAGTRLNGQQVCPEPDGADIVDLAIFPDSERFSSYYSGGLLGFFDELNSAVADVRARHGVRVFNMSLNVEAPVMLKRYSVPAERLDQIAEDNNVLIFVSAGNIAPQDLRPEWPSDTATALSDLAVAQNDGLLVPGESVRNVSIAALNPPDQEGSIPFAPARYSRRGPGLRSGVKPDLSHVGGSGTKHPVQDHGLFSILPNGAVVDGCGTSYATPLAAKTAARLIQEIEGEVSQETVIGLLVHNAETPEPLRSKDLVPVAHHLVGFGMPPSANQILETDEHSITLVFASRIEEGQQINFRFSWPPSLVETGGKCRGRAKLTLVSTPPLDTRFGSEFIRVNLYAALQQYQANDRWKGRLDPLHHSAARNTHADEADLIKHYLKWSPVKVFGKTFPKGVGPTSDWRLTVEYLTRSHGDMPDGGIPFTAILTISDPEGDAPVFNDLRLNLQSLGVQIADIWTAIRVTSRV